MKRILLAVVVLVAGQSAYAQRDAYSSSYNSMLGMERAMNQGMMELQAMKDARQASIQSAAQRAAQQEAMANRRQELNGVKASKRAQRTQLIRERAIRARETGSADRKELPVNAPAKGQGVDQTLMVSGKK